jgi:signal transduction histidine kinase
VPAPDPTQSHTEEVDRIRRRVINVVGHELRTPITTIRGLASQLATADPELVRDVLIPSLQRNAERVETLLDDLLIAAGVTTANPVTAPEEVDLAQVAHRLWTDLGGREEAIGGEGHAPVRIARGFAERICHHLFTTALQYGQDQKVTIGAGGTMEVRSTSVNVSADELELAFELFYRGEPAVMASAGMGLGLPVSRELARSAGGDVTVTTEGDVVIARLELPAA